MSSAGEIRNIARGEETLIQLDLRKDISFISDHVSIDIHEMNLSKVLTAFDAILADMDEQVEFIGGPYPVTVTRSRKKYSSAERDGRAFRYYPDEEILKIIVAILSDIAQGGKFDANHIDFEMQTKVSSLGLTFRFADGVYETRLPWQR